MNDNITNEGHFTSLNKRNFEHLRIGARALRRPSAAAYLSVSTTKFDEWTSSGFMPKPKKIDGVTLWDKNQLDARLDDIFGTNDAEDCSVKLRLAV